MKNRIYWRCLLGIALLICPNAAIAADYLRVAISGATGSAILEFAAVANKSYTVLYREAVDSGPWLRLQDFAIRPTNRVEQLVDPVTSGERYYRLTTPRNP